jgi:KaiC/GvpD/RAD55 family RecA-like ATPase
MSPVETKPDAGGTTTVTCRVCGGEVNARGECVVCGTKQNEPRSPEANGNLTTWLKGDSGANGLSTWIGAPLNATAQDAKDDALRKWLAGEDNAFQEWIGTPADARAGAAAGKGARSAEQVSDAKLHELRSKALEADGLRAELETMRATLTRELANFRSGRFDPIQYIEEVAALSKDLQTAIARRKELEQEIEHIKKGSIAVIKYVKGQQLKSGPAADLKKRVGEEAQARQAIEAELAELRAVNEALKDKIEVGLAKTKPSERELKKRDLELTEREARLKSRESLGVPRAASTEALGITVVDEELKRRLEEELREKEQEYLEKEEEFKKRIISLEEDVNKRKIEDQVRAQEKALENKPKRELEDALHRKEQELLGKERSMLLREQEIQRLQEEIGLKEDELKKLKEPLAFKEDELLRREEDLMYREKRLEAELRKAEQAKAQGGSAEEMDLKGRLEELKGEISQKEEEVRSKEKYLQQKMEELRLREQGMIEEEIEARSEERQVEVKQQKVRTGIARLDDLLFGGIPFGSNVSVYGPAYVGKDVLVNIFMAEGLKKGLPVLWVLTDKGPADIREEMAFVLPDYEEREKLGLVRYIDAYSKSMGADASDPNTTYIDDPTDHGAILKATDAIAAEWKKKYQSYRLAFRSVSTLIAYLDPTTTFKFLQPFVGRRKRDKSVAFYVIEKGMHEEQEIQMLGSLMDGSVEFKVEQLKSYLSVKGICDVQSRSWIRYTYTKSSVSIGSFSLDHIK